LDINTLLKGLRAHFPGPRSDLHFHSPYQLLVAVLLSAQTTDEKVNQITPELFRRYPDAYALAKTEPEALEPLIRPLGLANRKSDQLVKAARHLAAHHQGEIPDTMERLTAIPGIGRKSASAILVNAYGQPAIVVDTHMSRIANRLGLSNATRPEKIEEALKTHIPIDQWGFFSEAAVLFGRYVCKAKKPDCPVCHLRPWCPYEPKTVA